MTKKLLMSMLLLVGMLVGSAQAGTPPFEEYHRVTRAGISVSTQERVIIVFEFTTGRQKNCDLKMPPGSFDVWVNGITITVDPEADGTYARIIGDGKSCKVIVRNEETRKKWEAALADALVPLDVVPTVIKDRKKK